MNTIHNNCKDSNLYTIYQQKMKKAVFLPRLLNMKMKKKKGRRNAMQITNVKENIVC